MKKMTLAQLTAVVEAIGVASKDYDSLKESEPLQVAKTKLQEGLAEARIHRSRKARKRKESSDGNAEVE